MTALEQPSARQRRPQRRRPFWLRAVPVVLASALLFAVGVAVGMAVRDDPEPGGTVTLVRTLEPLPEKPAP